MSQLSADQPLIDPNDDRLNRSYFSQSIANALMHWEGAESLIISINGNWGSGKTTLKNFIARHLANNDTRKNPIIVEFNPWQWSGQDRILESFFKTIGAEFSRASKLWRLRLLWASLLRKLTRSTEAGLQAYQVLKDIIPSVLLATIAANILIWPQWTKIILAALLLTMVVAPIVLNYFFSHSHKTLEDTKQRISKEIARLDTPVIVFIDDIDRLTDQEIFFVFQLVKANINIPNLIYVLLFDRNIVQQALSKHSSDDSFQYLSKIVQVELEIPKISRQVLEDILVSKINSILGSVTVPSDQRTSNIYRPYILPYFSSIRDINRFIGSFDFYFHMHLKDGHLEVNVIDLIVVETLRIFDYKSYQRLSKFRFSKVYTSNEQRVKHWDAQFESLILDRAMSDESCEQLKSTVSAIFPQLRGWYSNENWTRDFRICDESHFNKYFEVSLNPDQQSTYGMFRLLLVSEYPQLLLTLEEALNRNLFKELIEYLIVAKDEVTDSQLIPLISALFSFGDCFSSRDQFAFFGGYASQCDKFIFQRLRLSDPNHATDILWAAFQKTTGLYLPIRTVSMDAVSMDDQNSRPEIPNRISIISEKRIDKFIQLALERIRATAESNKLLDMENAAYIIYRWSEWSKERDEVRNWFLQALKVPPLALKILRRVTSESLINNSHYEPYVNGKYIDNIIPLEDLADGFRMIPKGLLDPNDDTAISLFNKALERKRMQENYEQIRIRDLQ